MLATDIDVSWASGLGAPAEVRRHDVVLDDPPTEQFDLVHARLVLVHLPDRDEALRRMIAALRPGGWLVLEDADPALQPLSCLDPHTDAEQLANRIRTGFRALLAERGAELGYGRTLPRRLRAAGLREVTAQAWFPVALPACQRRELATIAHIRSSLLAHGIVTEAELDRHLAAVAAGTGAQRVLVPNPALANVSAGQEAVLGVAVERCSRTTGRRRSSAATEASEGPAWPRHTGARRAWLHRAERRTDRHPCDRRRTNRRPARPSPHLARCPGAVLWAPLAAAGPRPGVAAAPAPEVGAPRSHSSMISRSAPLRPMRGTRVRVAISSPVSAWRSWSGVSTARVARATLGPMPGTRLLGWRRAARRGCRGLIGASCRAWGRGGTGVAPSHERRIPLGGRRRCRGRGCLAGCAAQPIHPRALRRAWPWSWCC